MSKGLTLTFEGTEQMILNLQEVEKVIKERALKGMILSAIFIQRQMEITPPLTPVDTGNLRSSFFIMSLAGITRPAQAAIVDNPTFSKEKNQINRQALMLSEGLTLADSRSYINMRGDRNPTVVFGFTAYYASTVHDMADANFKRPGAGAFFFRNAIVKNKEKIREILITTIKKRPPKKSRG